MPIYLDHAATTPLRREALEAMLPYLTEKFGNASSPHAFGRAAQAGLDEARERVARAIGAQAREIVFTSGGSEANNLAVKGAAWAGKARGHRIVTTAVEHHSVGHTMRYLEKFGFEIVEVPVDRYGRVDPEEVEAAITPRTILVSVMLANNEVGTIQPIAEIAACVRRHRGVLLHTDAVQAAAICASTWRRWTSTCSPWRRTSSRGPRASARSTFAMGRTSWPSSRAGPRSGIAAPGPRTSRGRSAWRRRSNWRSRSVRPRPKVGALREALAGGARRGRRGGDRSPSRTAAAHPLDRGPGDRRGVGGHGPRPGRDGLLDRVRVLRGRARSATS